MKGKEYYGQRVLRGADLAFTDEREKLLGPTESLYKILEPRGKTYKRAQALFGLVRQSLPESFWEKQGMKDYFRDYSQFPIDKSKYALKYRVGSGNQCDCFLLESLETSGANGNSLVLKAFQQTGKSLEQVEEKARQVKQDYETLKGWYSEMPDLIPQQWEVIMAKFQRPHGKPMVGVIQKFLGNKVQDVALDFTDKEWAELCKEYPDLRSQLGQFNKITQRDISNFGKVPDLLGKDNLAVAWTAGKPHLVFLDPDGIDKIADMTPRVRKRVEDRLSLLNHRADT